MDRSQYSLDDLLRHCTVRVIVAQSGGTGFFVAPGLILTCAHVVKVAQIKDLPLEVHWDQKQFLVKKLQLLPEPTLELLSKSDYPYPDLALIKIDLASHPCVYLHSDITVEDKLYSYGYTDQYHRGDSALFVYEGPADDQQPLQRLKDSQARPGLSGAPLLNRRTGGVCGILKKSRGKASHEGGRAVPTTTILAQFSELLELRQRFHMQDKRWLDCLTDEQLRLIGWKETHKDAPFNNIEMARKHIRVAQESLQRVYDLLGENIWPDQSNQALAALQEANKAIQNFADVVPPRIQVSTKLHYVDDDIGELLSLITGFQSVRQLSPRQVRELRQKVSQRLHSLVQVVQQLGDDIELIDALDGQGNRQSSGIAKEKRAHLQNRLDQKHRRLQVLEIQADKFGIYIPPHITLEIEDLRREIADLEKQLNNN